MNLARTGRTIIGSVVFLDIVGYTKTSDRDQLAMKTALNAAVAEALKGVADEERIILDTGDGCAICFLGDPEEAMFVAGAIRLSINDLTGAEAQVLRIGINLGPLRVISDLSGRPNVVGDGINVAQRIMSFASDGEILVSRSYYEVVSCLSDDNKLMFQQLGTLRDKHVREHQVYALNMNAANQPLDQSDGNGSTPAHLTAAEQQRLATAGAKLAELIGPLASVITERAEQSSPNLDAAIALMAAAIEDEGDKAAFLQMARSQSLDLDQLANKRETVTVPVELDSTACAVIEQHFTNHMGPLAGMLIEKCRRSASSIEDLCNQLAAYLESDGAREKFLSAVQQDTVDS